LVLAVAVQVLFPALVLVVVQASLEQYLQLVAVGEHRKQ
jgi:hypothetical protein